MGPQSRWHPLLLAGLRGVGYGVGRWVHRPGTPPEIAMPPEPAPPVLTEHGTPTHEKVYGGNQTSYVARPQSDGWLQVHVHHQARQVREQIRRMENNPAALLLHEDAYGRSTIRAQFWLAHVIADHREYLRRNQVRFLFE